MPRPIGRARAAYIARSHPCPTCGEYSFKKVTVKPAPVSLRREFSAAWVVSRTCGVCGLEQEMGLDSEGEVVYAG